jgi:sugar phosphate isomerase/epimerase
MPLVEFIARARDWGLDGVQIADNVAPEKLSDGEIDIIFAEARRSNLELQWGFEGWDSVIIDRLLEISQHTQARLLRAVFGGEMFPDGMSRAEKVERALTEVSGLLPKLEEINLILAIENHFDLTTDEVFAVVETLNHPLVRVCLDTTNGLGELERPSETVAKLGAVSVAMHFKDFTIAKIIGGYQILGSPVGEGNQDCRAVLKQALQINPDIEVCIELGMPWPEDRSRMTAIETRWVETSVANTKNYLEEFYEQHTG